MPTFGAPVIANSRGVSPLVPMVVLCQPGAPLITLILDLTAESLSEAASKTVTGAVVAIMSDVGPSQNFLAR